MLSNVCWTFLGLQIIAANRNNHKGLQESCHACKYWQNRWFRGAIPVYEWKGFEQLEKATQICFAV
jgi:hypothetical protein